MNATTQRFIISIVVAGLVAGGLFVMAQQLRAQSAELHEVLGTIASQAAVDRAFSSLVNVLESTESERAQIDTFVVDGEQGTIDFLTHIESLAEQHGVEITGTTLETGTDETFDTSTLTVTFSFSGPQATTEAYLLALEQIPYASYVSTLSMAFSEERGATTPELRGQLTITAAVRNIDYDN